MTDKQIIKALRCWTGQIVKDEECAECSFGEDCTLGEIVDATEKRINELTAENTVLRKQISEMIMPPCTLGDTLYIVACTFGDGYVEDEIVHQSGFSVVKSIVTEKNFYKMCDLVRNGKAFFSSEAAERGLEELVGKCKCVRMAHGIEEK